MAEPAPRRRRFPWKRTAAILVLTPALVLTGLFVMTRQVPAHYREHQAFLRNTTPEQRRELASGVMSRFQQAIRQASHRGEEVEGLEGLDRLMRGRGDAESLTGGVSAGSLQGWPAPGKSVKVKLKVSKQELHALIAENAEDWVRQQGHTIPPEVRDPMVDYVNGQWVASCTLQVRDYSQVVSGYFAVNFQPGGMASGKMTGFEAGQLPVPVSEIGQFVAEKFGDPAKARQVDAAVNKLRGFEVQPTVQIDGRTVTVESLVAENGGFTIGASVMGGAAPVARR